MNDGAYGFDCMQHLRNVWLGGMEKALTSRLKEILRTDLDEIDPRLRVSSSISAVIRAVDKEFSLSANYPKGHGELFKQWMRDKHDGELLLHVERASGSRQDLCAEGSLSIVMNYPYYLEFLDEQLKKREKGKMASILSQNLFVVLKSSEMLALARLMSIFHLSVCMPHRWLAGCTHELREFEWGPMSMGRVIDTLESKMMELASSPEKINDEAFMMGIFQEYIEELPPMKEYWDTTFSRRQMKVITSSDGSKVVHLARLKRHLFHPTRRSDRETQQRMVELAKVAAEAFLAELRDPKKATAKYLSSSGSEYSWMHCPQERKTALLGNKATNDECESALGGCTSQVQRFCRINLTNAAAISDMKRNGFLHRPTRSKTDKKARGLFHEFDRDLQHVLILVAMQDVPVRKNENNADLELQARMRREKEEMAQKKNLEKASESYIEAKCLMNMYNSEKCVKGDPRQLTSILKKLGSETARLNAIKLNIKIRADGFGWEWCRTAWSENGRKFSVKELAKRLRWIIKEEQKFEVPTEPAIKVPRRKDVGSLGIDIDFIRELDERKLEDEGEFKKNAERKRQGREDQGGKSLYSRMQPFERPNIEDLLERRIDVQYMCDVDGKPTLRWCQGEVVEVYDDRKKPTVKVLWDATPDIAGYEEQSESDQVLLPGKWNRNCENAWRMDVEIFVGDEEDDINDDKWEGDEIDDDCFSDNDDDCFSNSDSDNNSD